jgi:hypothetical protein
MLGASVGQMTPDPFLYTSLLKLIQIRKPPAPLVRTQ